MKFRNIIILMLLTMIGLIGFQWYWIKNAIAVRKEQFDRNVNDALQQTVRKIETQEIIYLTKQKIKAQEQKKLFALTQKKAARKKPKPKAIQENFDQNDEKIIKNAIVEQKVALMPEGESQFLTTFPTEVFPTQSIFDIPDRHMDLIREMLEEQNMVWEELSQKNRSILLRDDLMRALNRQLLKMNQPSNDRIRTRVYHNQPLNLYDVAKLRNEGKEMIISGDSVWINIEPAATPLGKNQPSDKIEIEEKPTRNKPISPPSPPQKVNYENAKEKADLMKSAMSEVFSDVMQEKRNIHERVDKQTIDTLLKKELLNRDITIPYHYGVKNNSNMIFSSFAVNYDSNILESAYKAQLFPSDQNPQFHFLYVYFPNNQGFILRNMWTVFASSAFLILLIGGIFYSSIYTMFQQKKLAESKNDFINNMTHEFKTPISTISLAVEVMKDSEVKKDVSKMNRYLSIIQDENKRLGTQVEKVLQMALLDKGEVKLKLGLVNIHETIEQVMNNLSVQIEQKNGIINLEMDAENPEIEVDEVHLTNIIYNLLDNANKYSPENPEITIKTENIGNSLKISIIDKGIGMSKDQIERIFEKFYRVSTGNLHDVKGFGLGLSYVKKMVDSHNGQINVISKIGEGSTFEVILNCRQALVVS